MPFFSGPPSCLQGYERVRVGEPADPLRSCSLRMNHGRWEESHGEERLHSFTRLHRVVVGGEGGPAFPQPPTTPTAQTHTDGAAPGPGLEGGPPFKVVEELSVYATLRTPPA